MNLPLPLKAPFPWFGGKHWIRLLSGMKIGTFGVTTSRGV